MYNLSKKDANDLIELIHECLKCDNLSAFHGLVNKFKRLTAINLAANLSCETGENAGKMSLDISELLQRRADIQEKTPSFASVRSEIINASAVNISDNNSPESGSRVEVILHYALPHVRQALSRAAKDESQKQTDTLSRREREVLKWMSEGKCTWDISRILRITERTVYYHSQNIMQKLEATSRSHAVSIAIKRGIIELH